MTGNEGTRPATQSSGDNGDGGDHGPRPTESSGPTKSGPTEGLFRAEFLREYGQRSRPGDVLRISPAWVERTYWLSIALAIAGVLYGILGRVSEYCAGPAVVRFSDRADLTALSSGTVTAIEVQPGEHVTAGQTLVRFHSSTESGDLERIDREFQLQLINLLRDPSDPAARQRMVELRAERDQTLSRLDERVVRAPIDGTVRDIRIRSGEHLEAGELVLSVIGPSPRLFMVAFLPGQYRPLLRTGLPVKLELTGFPYVHQDLRLYAVGDEIVGPEAVRRYLGADLGDAVAVPGSAVLAYASLPRPTFRWEGKERGYYDGMQGRAQVGVRTQSVFAALIPGVRTLLEKLHG